VTLPNGVKYREIFSTTNGTRGLTTRTETRESNIIQQFTDITWLSDSTISPPLLPRVSDIKVCDDRNHDGQITAGTDKLNRTRIDYVYPAGNLRLPGWIWEYDATGQTVYRGTMIDYTTTNYVVMGTTTTRRIIGLPSYVELYEGNFATRVARTEYSYDSPNESGSDFLKAHTTLPSQHDSVANGTGNFGTGFPYRGNLTKARRFSVVNGVVGSSIETRTGYHITGTVAWARDGENDETQFVYDDAFTAGLSTSPSPPTYAYPTRVTQIDTPMSVSQFKYHFDHGAVTETIDPKSYNVATSQLAKVINTYDTKGRLERATIWRGNGGSLAEYSRTRHVYSTDHLTMQSWTTVNSLSEEATVVRLLDGLGRGRITISDHPGSAGGLRSEYVVYDVMGRVAEWSNPTEVNGSWMPSGDEPAYYASKQDYDWKGRPTVLYRQDHTTQQPCKRVITYTGCGCTGSDVTTITDEVGCVKRIYRDAFGRENQTELLNGSNVYTTTQTKYNVRDQMTEHKQIVGTVGASLIATYEYDGHGRLWRRKLPIEGAATQGTRFIYFNDDDVATVTDPRGVIATYTYNNRGLVTNISFNPNGAPNVASFGPVSFTYDEAGNRLSMTDAAGFTNYSYDNLSRMEWERRHFNDVTQNYYYYLYYQYNLAGQVKEVKDQFNDAIYYNYDKAGRVTSVTGADLTRNETYQFTSTVSTTLIKYRAWDEVKYIKYGNNLVNEVTAFDKRMRPTFFQVNGKVQGPDDPDPSPLAMKTEHEYYADGQARYFKDHKSSAYDRAYKWDFAGRLEESYSGDEARVFAGKPQSYVPGPYRQSYQHDVFGRMTSRTNRFWSKNVGLTINYNPVTGQTQNTIDTVNGQQTTGPTWQYDAAGNVTQDNNLKYFYNAAGLNWQAQDLASVPKVTQEYDGDGLVVKRGCSHYLNSTVLGVAVTELDCLNNKYFSNVYLGATRIAQLIDGTNYHNPPDKWVVWDHVNPVAGSNGRSTELSWYYREAEPDPLGVNVGFEDPYVPPNPPPDTNAETGLPGLYAAAGETGKRCSLDGVIVDCGFVIPLIEGGAAVIAPDKNIAPVYNKNTNQFVGYAFFDSNRGGYAFNYWALEPSRHGLRILDEYGNVMANDPATRQWEWVKKTKVFNVDVMQGDLIAGNLGWQQGARGRQNPKPQDDNLAKIPVSPPNSDCDKKLASIFGGPGAVAAGSGYEPSTLPDPHNLKGVFYAHIYASMHIYPNPEGKMPETPVGLNIPAGGGRPFSRENIVPDQASYGINYSRLGNLTNVTLVVTHVANFNPRKEPDGRVRIGDIGGLGGTKPGYVHSHLGIIGTKGERYSFVDAFCK
jgi:YD repeat-containing protein